MAERHALDTSPPVSDAVRHTTCYMCACRCGIRVHLKDGAVRYIEGNPNHPVNRGVLCAKGSAGIMHLNSPARLTKPLRRVGARGSGDFEEIEWPEALDLATAWLARARATSPRKLAFFTGRDQSQALTSWWAQQFGTPNYAAHGGFCSVNMAAGGLYTMGSAFWEFSEPDWDHCRYFLLFGVAEDHDSNPIKAGLGRLKGRGAKVVSINPVRTGYSAIADEWIGITPGTDGLFVLSLVHELLRAGRVDADYLARTSNAGWLVIEDPGGPSDGLFARDEAGRPLCWDRHAHRAACVRDAQARPTLRGEFRLDDGRRVKPVFHLIAERYLGAEYAPETVAARTGIAAETIRRIAAELAQAAFDDPVVLDIPWTDWTGHRHAQTLGRPVSMHAMRGISAHANGFHTCRALHLLQILLGTIDTPGGMRYKPPYPKSLDSLPRPTGVRADINPNRPLPGPHLGFPRSPADLLIDAEGRPARIDKAFSWDAPLAVHGMIHTVIANAVAADPYAIDTLFMYMANMAWNSSMNVPETLRMLTATDPRTGDYKIPHFIYSDAFYSETVAYADLILPDTTYLERWDCISLLDRPISDADACADAIRQPVVALDRDVRPFQDTLLDLGARLGLPGMVDDDGAPRFPGGYADYLVNHERKPGIGMLAGWRGRAGSDEGKGAPNPDQLTRYVDNQGFWRHELAPAQRYWRNVNRAYLDFAHDWGFIGTAEPIIHQLWAEELQTFRLAAQGHGAVQPPEHHRARIARHFDPLPFWHAPLEDDLRESADYPLHAVTQRPMAMYHSWGSHNAWLRQIHASNHLYVPRELAAELGLGDDDWVWIESRVGRVRVRVRTMAGVNAHTVWTWNAIAKRAGAWNLATDAPEVREAFMLNNLIDDLLPAQPGGYRYANVDPVTGQAAWYDLRVRLRRAGADDIVAPSDAALVPPPGMAMPETVLRYGARFRKARGS